MILHTNYHRRLFMTLTLQLAMTWGATSLGQSAQANIPDAVRGTWILRSIYPTQNVEGPSPRQQRKLLGSRISIGKSSLVACRQSVAITSVDVHAVTAAKFLANTRVSLEKVGFDAPTITEVVINERQPGTCYQAFPLPRQDIYIKNKHELLIDFEGVFYRALKEG
jgi:hypothetical protein